MPWGLTRFHHSGQSHFVTFCCYHRRRLFTTDASRQIFESALERVRRSFRLQVYGYVVMPEHVHLLLSEPQRDTLADALKSLKQGVSRRLMGNPPLKPTPELRVGQPRSISGTPADHRPDPPRRGAGGGHLLPPRAQDRRSSPASWPRSGYESSREGYRPWAARRRRIFSRLTKALPGSCELSPGTAYGPAISKPRRGPGARTVHVALPVSDIMLSRKLGWERGKGPGRARLGPPPLRQARPRGHRRGRGRLSRGPGLPPASLRRRRRRRGAQAALRRYPRCAGPLYRLRLMGYLSPMFDVPLEYHAHNDLGLATANALAAAWPESTRWSPGRQKMATWTGSCGAWSDTHGSRRRSRATRSSW